MIQIADFTYQQSVDRHEFIYPHYLLQYLQILCGNFVLPQLPHLTNFEKNRTLSASLLPFLCVECFLFGSGAIIKIIIAYKIPLDKWKRNSLYLIYMKKFKKGFTLIELLIVIALLGALAVGLLAALDPFEQLKKGTDTGVRNTVSEVQGGAVRFYALKNNMPWCSATDSTACSDPVSSTLTILNGGTSTTTPYAAIDQMSASGELKSNFVTLAGSQMNLVYVTGTNDPAEIIVCFKPNSKAFQADRNTKYTIVGVEDTGCKSQGSTKDCYWCVQ